MKILAALFLVLALSCSHRPYLEELRSEVSQHEARNLEEIRSELNDILEHHPELSNEVKAEISKRLEETLVKHQELRNQESRVIQYVLKEAVATDSTDDNEQKAQRKELRTIYEQKSENLFELVHAIRKLTGDDDKIKQEMEILFREFR